LSAEILLYGGLDPAVFDQRGYYIIPLTAWRREGVIFFRNVGAAMSTWKTTFLQELGLAQQARARQNEGQARVCARRAAGALLREYFVRRGLAQRSASAMDLLKTLLELADLPSEARQAAERLTLRVNPDFQIPAEIDLLAETQILAQVLLPGEMEE
jgi:hypothetical protein